MNKTTKQYISVVAFVLGTTISLLTTPTANAGVMDWITPEKTEKVTVKDSFDFALSYVKNDVKAEETEYDAIKKKYNVIRTYKVVVTAYNSLAGQTDSTPCIGAAGLKYDLCKRNKEDVIAANFLPLHTKVLIPELGGHVHYVLDRMNARYTPSPENGYEYRIDRWMKDHEEAKKFGKRTYTMYVLAPEK